MQRILVTDPLSELGLAKLKEAEGMEVVLEVGAPKDRILEIIGEYDALLVRSQTKVTAEILQAGKRLKVVGRAGVGVDNIDVKAATKAGILVINAPDGNTITTSEFTFAMMLAMARNIPQAYFSLQNGRWDRNRFLGVELRGKVLGIVGLGRIGTEVAKRAQAFQMHIMAYDPFLTPARAEKLGIKGATLDEVFAAADFITVHTPLTKDTRKLISTREFGLMKRGVRLVNCARGGIIDETALKQALDDGIVAGVALDVFEEEPGVGNPLLAYDQVIATPHLGASTDEAQVNVAVDVADGVVKLLRGEDYPHTVNLPPLSPEARQAIQPFADLGEILGSMAVQMFNQGIQRVQIQYEGEPADLAVDSITRATLKGVLTHQYREDVHLISAPLIAQEMGIDVVESKSPRNQAHKNRILVILENDTKRVSVAGTVLPGHGLRIVEVDEFPVDIPPTAAMLLTWHRDRPGIIGHVGGVLGTAGVNIASMQVGRRAEGGEAIMIVAVDRAILDDSLQSIRNAMDVETVQYIELPMV